MLPHPIFQKKIKKKSWRNKIFLLKFSKFLMNEKKKGLELAVVKEDLENLSIWLFFKVIFT